MYEILSGSTDPSAGWPLTASLYIKVADCMAVGCVRSASTLLRTTPLPAGHRWAGSLRRSGRGRPAERTRPSLGQ